MQPIESVPVWVMGGNLHSQSTEEVHQSSAKGSVEQLQQTLNQLKATTEVLEQIGTFASDATTTVDHLANTTTNVIHVVGEIVNDAKGVISSGLNEADIIGQLSDKGAAVRLEKTTLGLIKGMMTLTYFGSAWMPGQIVCAFMGVGMMAISGVDYLRGKPDTRFNEGASLAIAPSRWLVNMAMSTYNDIKGAYVGKEANNAELTHVMGNKSFVATFESLEAEITAIFYVDEKEARSIEQKVAGICKGVIAFEAIGSYTAPLVISTFFGLTAMGSAAYNGQSVQQGANIIVSPVLVFGALVKSAYHDFVGR